MLSSALSAAQPRHYLDTGEAIISQSRAQSRVDYVHDQPIDFLLGAHGLALLGRWTEGIVSGDRSPVRGANPHRTSCAVAQLGRKICGLMLTQLSD